ncbi:MAG: hydantoinase B/oxoprolinase family protein [Parvibaculaceae bacterium]|nr:hydantoinase B/oxoprolinase family protein [Parvibaculaceae bacterium]
MSENTGEQWDFWIDRGGTFTDIVARDPEGRLHTHKLLSENPERYEDAALQGIRDLLGVAPGADLPGGRIGAVKMGTTVATNALLERQGAPVLLLTSEGFADALAIGYQNRPHLFRLKLEKPGLLYARATGVPERVTAEGEVLQPLDEELTRRVLAEAYGEGIRAVAILFMHGYRYPAHEAAAARIAAEIGFTQISTSHGTSPLMKFVARGDTTVVDAYLSPILRRYVDRVAGALGETGAAEGDGPRLYFMQSSGGLTDARLFQGKDAILSGPAGGVVGAVETARLAGFGRIIGFDMGGTSTDVCHYDGELERTLDAEVAGVRVRAPMMLIHTVAAGGGSILHWDGARMRVGPQSAGADPGPACYRRGGPLTVTDANLMAGKLIPAFFPAVFGPGGDQPLDPAPVHEGFARLAAEIGRSPEEVADGYLRIAVENMAQAIKKISVQRGYDVSRYALVSFGGAGGQHACLVADALGMRKVFLHPLSGVLSAYGMGLAQVRAARERAVEAALEGASLAGLAGTIEALKQETQEELLAQGIAPDRIGHEIRLHIRYAGTDTALAVAHGGLGEVRTAFEQAHRQRFGFIAEARSMVVEALSVEAIGEDARAGETPVEISGELPPPEPDTIVRLFSEGTGHSAPVLRREKLRPGHIVPGPAIIIEPHQTIVVEEGWRAEVTALDHIVLERLAEKQRAHAIGTKADPVLLEIFNNLFMSIAEQMGVTLEKTAFSVNIKERLDFSCAVFDAHGGLVANAPHMPVHLGSMGASVQAIIDQNDAIAPGDVFVLNAPYNGGTHLPDVTVIAPVFGEGDAGAPLFYVAARGHHADIGGITPGSMPAHSRTVAEEGVLIDNFRLVDKGRFREAELRALLASGPWPVRNVEQNLADIRAQIAACEKGIQELHRMTGQFGLETVRAYMAHVQDNAEESVRRVIGILRDARFESVMDDGARICVEVRVDREARSAVIDFTGTSPTLATNLNAPSAVCRAAVLYVFRCLVGDEIPLNEGCLKPITIVIPEGSMLAPRYPAAVVGGNVETSQWVTDALFGALGVMASAQGTMNNLTFGNARYQYYETICGGAGAGPDFDGADAIHTHMTNSRLTDPEVLEWRFPVLLERFAIRHGSGGKGRHRGGEGVERIIRFREPMTAAILSTHRSVAPFGLEGGEPGAVGENWLRHRDGILQRLDAADQAELEAGDALIIRTPGGGGFGPSG